MIANSDADWFNPKGLESYKKGCARSKFCREDESVKEIKREDKKWRKKDYNGIK